MTLRIGHLAAALLLPALAGAGLPGGHALAAGATPAALILHPGESGADVLQGGGVAAIAVAAHDAWTKAGRGVTSPQDRQALALQSGKVLSNTLRVGDPFGFPAVQFAYTAGTPGLLLARFTFTAPNGARTVRVTYTPPVYATKDHVSFAAPEPLPYYIAPGAWTLTAAELVDAAGDVTVYGADQLAGLFATNTITVINPGPVDADPPVLVAGHVLTPTVSLSAAHPTLKVALKVADAGTGVSRAVLFLTAPGAPFNAGQNFTIPLPVKSGTITIYDAFYPGQPTGLWKFAELLVCDAASNCDTVSDPQAIADLLGANSVTVTN